MPQSQCKSSHRRQRDLFQIVLTVAQHDRYCGRKAESCQHANNKIVALAGRPKIIHQARTQRSGGTRHRKQERQYPCNLAEVLLPVRAQRANRIR